MTFLNRVASFKYRATRLMPYFSIVQLIMVGIIFFQTNGWHWWYLLVAPFPYLVYMFEKRYALKQEMRIALSCNPEWENFKNEIFSKIDELKKEK